MARIIDAFTQFFDDNGDPLVNGWLKFNVSGTNNTDKTTYADINETIPNQNPLQLDAAGRCPNVFGTGAYNVISFADDAITPGKPGQQIQQFDPVGGTLNEGAFSDWLPTTIYSFGDIVTASNWRYYRSLVNDNKNNEPSISPTQWEEITFNCIWNANITYGLGDSVFGADGYRYTSLISDNTNNDPVSDTIAAFWTLHKRSSVLYTHLATEVREIIEQESSIINGNFDWWQYGFSQTSNGIGSDDRWYNLNSGSTKEHTREAFTPGQTNVPGNPLYFSQTVVTSVTGASNHVSKLQTIPGVRTHANETITLGFRAKSDASRNMAIDFEQFFGAGGTPSASVTGIGAQKVLLTSNWNTYFITVAIPDITGKDIGTEGNDSLRVRFWFDAGTDFDTRTDSLGHQSGTFSLSSIFVVKGGVPIVHRMRERYADLKLCQRFYRKSYNVDVPPGTITQVGAIYGRLTATGATSINNMQTSFENMRAVPSIIWLSPATGASGNIHNLTAAADLPVSGSQYTGEGTTGAPQLVATTTVNNTLEGHYTASAEI